MEFDLSLLVTFVTLTLLEIILGVDNLIFIALVANKLPAEYRNRARLVGLTLALVIRVIMLLGVSWVMQMTQPVVTVAGMGFSVRDLLLLAGGIFLIYKST